jgi:epoxyqueuosine reductase QueG
VPEDYHRFFTGLFDDILPRLREKFPENKFAGFTDHSPIDERAAAAAAGLGFIGRHGLLITEPYSSYVFLGEIIADPDTAADEDAAKPTVRNSAFCENCNLCVAACPFGLFGGCLSALTQKKGELSEDEKKMIAKYGFSWGCDICQEVCPHTAAARSRGSIYTSIPYFLRALTPRLTRELVLSMSDEEFSRRAYSWRGRETILRNLELIESSKAGTAGNTEEV